MSTLEDRIRDGLNAERDVPDLLGAVHAGARRRQSRRTAGSVGATALVVALVATGASILVRGGDDISPSPAPQPTTTAPSPSPSEQLFGGLTVKAQAEVLTGVLLTWQDVVAERLDPTGEHLEVDPELRFRHYAPTGTRPTPYDGVPGMLSLPELGWSNPGETGTGMVELTVFAHWGSSDGAIGAREQMPCLFLETPCGRFEVEGARRAFGGSFADHPALGDGFFVALERTDGTSVIVTVTNLFGNNTQAPLSGTGLTRDDLVAVALDPRIALPQAVQP